MKKWTMPWKNWPRLLACVCKTCLFFLLFFLNSALWAQHVHHYTLEPESSQKATQAYRQLAPFTAIVIIDENATEHTRSVFIDGQIHEIHRDEHAPEPTFFLSLPQLSTGFELPDVKNKTDVYTINSGPEPQMAQRSLQEENDCLDIADAIPQSAWRAGLPDPNYTRSFHEVTHHIVHHTAGSNSNTNYVQVVRDIYLYHTEVNGWSDIGYNFLVAQDGTLFEGRDPGGSMSEFDVRGAHFCAKNTGTLGIALLGNYELTHPSEEMIARLVRLLSLSLSQLDIHPESTADHRGLALRAISGHRDGCSTLCPGAHVYSILPDIRSAVLSATQDCPGTLELVFDVEQEIATGDSITFNNTSSGYDSFRWRFEGGSPETSTEASPKVFYARAGFYDVTLFGETDGVIDSLYADDHIQVIRGGATPTVYPNAVAAGSTFTIEFSQDIGEVNIYSVSGHLVAKYARGEFASFQAPENRGLYTLVIEAGNNLVTQKLVVR